MKYPRVNLLKKSEQRYQGAVSRRFMLVSSVITPIILIAILSGVKLIQFAGVQSDLESSRKIWGDLKPRLALHQDEQRCLNGNEKILELIGGWRSTQVSQFGLMAVVVAVVVAVAVVDAEYHHFHGLGHDPWHCGPLVDAEYHHGHGHGP